MTRHGEAYADASLPRLYETFGVCCRFATRGAKILSVGAGGAYVEKLLRSSYDAEVTVIEFPEAVEAHREDYARHGFQAVGRDLAGDWEFDVPERFDMVLSFEVLEHLPVSPHQHIQALSDKLKPGGASGADHAQSRPPHQYPSLAVRAPHPLRSATDVPAGQVLQRAHTPARIRGVGDCRCYPQSGACASYDPLRLYSRAASPQSQGAGLWPA